MTTIQRTVFIDRSTSSRTSSEKEKTTVLNQVNNRLTVWYIIFILSCLHLHCEAGEKSSSSHINTSISYEFHQVQHSSLRDPSDPGGGGRGVAPIVRHVPCPGVRGQFLTGSKKVSEPERTRCWGHTVTRWCEVKVRSSSASNPLRSVQ